MSLEINKESSVQLHKFQAHEIDSANIKELTLVSSAEASTSAQVVQLDIAKEEDVNINFFIIGGVINITMILAYFVWAFFQWKKINKREKKQ